MKDLSLLLLRGVAGGLMAGHGAQKLFGAFGGSGIEGTTGIMQHLRLQPARPYAYLAGISEFGGGALTTLGLLNPIGPIATIAAMTMATATAHWNKPIWNTKGGAELPVINMSIALALAAVGSGKFSLDNLLGIKLPQGLVLGTGLALALGGVATSLAMRQQPEDALASQAEAPQQSASAQPEEKAVPDVPQGAQEQEFVDDSPAPVTPANAAAINFGNVHPVQPGTGLGINADLGQISGNPS